MAFKSRSITQPPHLRRNGAFAALTVAVLVLAACSATPDGDSAPPSIPSVGAEECAALEGATVAGVEITSVSHVAAGDEVEAGFCQVSGSRAPFLDLEVDLPDQWSGRLFQQGGGGFNGAIRSVVERDEAGDIVGVHPALSRHGAIYAASNGGNRADVPEEAAPGLWAQDSDEARASLRDYAFGSLWTTLQFARGLADEYYGSTPERTYFSGCSNGGREAYIVAERWPEEYDGIVSGCEGGDTGRQVAAWLSLGSVSGTPAEVRPEQFQWAYAAAVAECDLDDGIEDGYLANPAACDFDPALLACSEAQGDPSCLSAEQVVTFQTLLSPITDGEGAVMYEAFTWTDFSSMAPFFGQLGGGFAMVATGDPNWTTPQGQADYDIDEDFASISYGLLELGADHNLDELAAYAATGGRLLSWHAAGDNLLSSLEHAAMFEDLQGRLSALGVEDASEQAIYLQVPANNHGDGSSPSEVDWTGAIIDWVENGQSPTSLVYSFDDDEGQTRGLPVCEYPRYPAYVDGDVGDAGSYECREP